MTKVKVNPGVCGMETTIEVEKIDRMNFSVKIDSKCEMINRMAGDIAEISMRDAIRPQNQSAIYEASSNAKTHPVCPLPMAILKAIEAEAGLALKRPVMMEFID